MACWRCGRHILHSQILRRPAHSSFILRRLVLCRSPSAGGGGGGSAARSGPVYRGGPTYNTYVAPPVYGGYGYGGGFSLFPTFVSPVFGFGGESPFRCWQGVHRSGSG